MDSKTATTLQKKKLNKNKLKKTIKNVLCRPDPVFWVNSSKLFSSNRPAVTEDQTVAIEAALNQHKVDVPVFTKPLWKDLKSIPKELRPKPPKTEKVEGLFFGISECCNMIQTGQCSAIIIEATVNPRSIVQPILEACVNSITPVVCIEGLRKISASNFGIPTSCLGIRKEFLTDISQKITEIGTNKLPEQKVESKFDIEMAASKIKDSPMEVDSAVFQYLYRNNKKSRAFVPPSDQKIIKASNKFIGQNFIEFPSKPEHQKKRAFKKMIVKRISNNPNRTKSK